MHNNTYLADWKRQTVRFLAAQTVSLFGSSIVQYAVIWHIALETSSGAMVTLSVLFAYAPQMLVSLFAGVWLDRHDRKKTIMAADALIACATLAAAVLFWSGRGSLWLLFAVLAVRSAGTGVQTPAVNAFIPQIVPQKHLMRVNGINSTLSSATMFLAPAASGAVLGWLGLTATFMIDVVTAIIGIGMMFTVFSPGVPKTAAGKKSVREDLKAGFAYLKVNRFVRQQIGYLGVILVLASPAAFLTPLLVSRTFGPQVWRLSVSEMVFSAGMIAGGLLVSAWGGFKNRRLTVIASSVYYGTMMVGIGAAANFGWYLAFNLGIGLSLPFYTTAVNVSLQERAAPQMHGRVFGLVQLVSAGALPAGLLTFGPLADYFTVQTLIACSGTVMILFALWVWYDKRFANA